jgi:DHA1 family tetracycline resistance protein-like MFS transporter
MASTPSARQVIWIGFAVALVDALGLGILIPIIPLLFADPLYQYHLGISISTGYLLLGTLTALYPFTMFLALPIMGQLSDTFGRRPVLLLSLLGTAGCYALFAVGIILRSIPLLFLARALDGITGGNVAVVQAAIADTSGEHDERVRKFGVISAANGVGFILGPLFGGLLSDPEILHWFGAPTPFWFAAGISLATLLLVLFLLPETLTVRTKNKIKVLQALQNIKEAASGIERRLIYITAFLYQAGLAFIVTFFGVYLVFRFGFGQREIGFAFAFVGLLLAFTQLTITRTLSRRVPPEMVTPAALMLMSGSLIGIYFVHDVLALYLYTVPVAISAALVASNLTGLLSARSSEHEQGSALGINSSVQALAQAIPPLFAGAIAAVFAATTPILFAALTIGAAGIFFMLTWYGQQALTGNP